jgi:allantoin racemase
MKIWWQNSSPVHATKECAGFLEALTQHLNSVKRKETQISFNSVEKGSLDLHFNSTVALNTFGPGGVLNRLIQAEREGYDAVAVGCFLDPALDEARELIDIPIFSLAETSMHVACMLGSKFSGIAFADKQAQYYDGLARKYGLESRAVPFVSLGTDLAQVFGKGFSDPSEMMDLFKNCVKKLVAAGAEVILPACGAVSMLVVKEKITEMEGALILDVNGLLLKITEAMVDFYKLTGVSRSRTLLYKKPAREKIEQILRIYNFK